MRAVRGVSPARCAACACRRGCILAAATSASTSASTQDEELVCSGFVAEAVSADAVGERVSVEVGPVANENGPESGRRRRTFVFAPKLSQPSSLVTVTLPRPMGIVFAPDRQGRARIESLVSGSHAGRAASVGKLSGMGAQAPQVGDLLRACTSTVFTFTPQAHLLGDLKGTKRVVTCFGADGQPWRAVSAALRQGMVADGAVTLVLERPAEGSLDVAWEPMPAAATVAEEEEEEETSEEQAERRKEEFAVEGPSSDTVLVAASAIAGFALLIFTGFRP